MCCKSEIKAHVYLEKISLSLNLAKYLLLPVVNNNTKGSSFGFIMNTPLPLAAVLVAGESKPILQAGNDLALISFFGA